QGDRRHPRPVCPDRQEPPRSHRSQARYGRPRRNGRDGDACRGNSLTGTYPERVTVESDDGRPAALPLLEPRGGIPPVVEDAPALADVIARFAQAAGPVAVDAERASGYRYGQRAYLVQLRREGAGTSLACAALDVASLVDLRNALEGELEQQGKLTWAHEEFEAILATPPAPPRTDPWRRTSGIHRLRGRRQLAVVRALWEARDELAQ